METVVTWPNLKSLSLNNLTTRTDGESEWKELRNLSPSVTSLKFQLCQSIGDIDLNSLSRLPKLESLRIETVNWSGITDNGFRSLARAAHLKSLEICGSAITDEGMRGARSLESLERLELNCLATPAGLESLATLKRLNWITIGSPDLSEADVMEFGATQPQLSKVDFQQFDVSRPKTRLIEDKFLRIGMESKRAALNALEGNVAPQLSVKEWVATESDVKLEDFRGKVVLLNFWGAWCGACVQKTPFLKKLQEKYREEGLVIVGIHSTFNSNGFESFLGKNQLSWPNGIDDGDRTAKAYSVDNWPAMYLIDRDGTLSIANPVADQLEDAIKYLIKK